MNKCRFTPEASADLFEIWSYIADDDPKAANRVEDAIHAGCALLAESPLIGSVRKELTDLPLRFWVVRPLSELLDCVRPWRETAANYTHSARGERSSAIVEITSEAIERGHRPPQNVSLALKDDPPAVGLASVIDFGNQIFFRI
jgi:plasmid stabilization system protein ParE